VGAQSTDLPPSTVILAKQLKITAVSIPWKSSRQSWANHVRPSTIWFVPTVLQPAACKAFCTQPDRQQLMLTDHPAAGPIASQFTTTQQYAFPSITLHLYAQIWSRQLQSHSAICMQKIRPVITLIFMAFSDIFWVIFGYLVTLQCHFRDGWRGRSFWNRYPFWCQEKCV